MNEKKRKLTVRWMVTVAMLSAVAEVLMQLRIVVPFLPSFYKIDFSELPIMICAFALGPVAGAVSELIKILLNFLINGTDSIGVGELANFLVGCSFVLPASIIYTRHKTKKNAIIGLGVGTAVCIAAGAILNAYVLLPAYAAAFGGMDNIIGAGTKVNKGISSLGTFILLATVPLNLIKCLVSGVLSVLLYKPLSRYIKGEN